MTETSIPSLLRERASLQSGETAFTFLDYDQDWNGIARPLTWMQLYRRTVNLAARLEEIGTTGDRAVILAPQGLDYIVAFLGAMQAGMIAVPLAVPLGGVSDERVSSVMADAAPTIVLTTSAVAEVVSAYVRPRGDGPAPVVVVVDSLDLDGSMGANADREDFPEIAYLQYTSGSTRTPAGVVLTHDNVMANFEQLVSGFFSVRGNVVPPGATIMSWLPFYHDMGLYLGVCAPVLLGVSSVVTSPVSFLQRPARWLHLLASNSKPFTAAPNFAFELAARKTSDEDMAGVDLSNVLVMLTGSERVHPATLARFSQRFSPFGLDASVIRPSYGLAEATVYATTRATLEAPSIVRFDTEKLTAGTAERGADKGGTPLVSYGVPTSPAVRIVDTETFLECPEHTVGEIWLHGGNVASGYWNKPQETEATFGGRLAAPSDGAPTDRWLRTGDSGFLFEGELYIIGRIKDLLIVYGRNHSPDDIEATIQEVTRGRCAAIAVSDSHTEKLVVIAELRARGGSEAESAEFFDNVKREVAASISDAHGLAVADLVLVAQGSIPITTSGKVRRSSCVELYRTGQFTRLDA